MKNFLIPIVMLLMLAACGGGAGTSSNPNPDTSDDVIVSDDPSASGFALLKSESESEPVIRHEGGLVRSALFRIPSEGGEAVEEAFDFFEKYKDILGVSDPVARLYLKKNHRDKDGGEHLFFGIRKGDVSLEGILIGLNREGGFWTSLSSNVYLAGLENLDKLELAPVLSTTDAEDAAIKHLLLSNSKIAGISKLVMFNPQLIDGDNKLLLTYKVHVQGKNASGIFEEYFVFVNAQNGAVENVQSLTIDAKDFDIESALTGDSSTCWFFVWESKQYWFNQDGEAGYPGLDFDMLGDGQNAFNFIHEIYDFYQTTFNHRSWDGSDGDNVWAMVHTGVNWGNASYSPGCGVIKFGDGWATLDIVAHEFTHAVVRFAGDLVYQNESGALNESFADVFAYFIDNDDDLIGEDLPGDGTGIRSMQNPPLKGQPDHVNNLCTMATDYCGFAADNGGVHTNSGIFNKVAYLLLNGGTHNSIVVHAIDRSRVQKLWYDTLWNRIGSNFRLVDARDAFVAQVQSYVDRSLFGYTRRDVCEVRNAFVSVGLGTGDIDCDGREDFTDSDDDGDFVPDSTDNCPTLSNPRQADLDGDGTGDACDIDQDGDNIWEDGDGTLSERDNLCTGGQFIGCDDNCPTVANADQADTDGDTIGDICDDEDRDGIFNVDDNCPNNANTSQDDRDADGTGDACDNDRDGDGRNNDSDNCPDTANPSQSDSDGDGVGNLCDNCVSTSNADQSNVDGDSQGNACDTDDDGDSVVDSDDNCPNDFNPDQTDLGGGDAGLVCDDDEAAMLDGSEAAGLRQATLYFRDSFDIFRIPVRPCLADGCPNWLEAGSLLNVDVVMGKNPGQYVQLPQLNQLRIVDSNGIVLASDFGTGSTFSISAPISADTHFMPPGGLEAGVTPFNGTEYFLEIAPMINSDQSSFEIEAQIGVSLE